VPEAFFHDPNLRDGRRTYPGAQVHVVNHRRIFPTKGETR
jgi:hypothetical protein